MTKSVEKYLLDTNALTKIGRNWGQPPDGHIIWVLLIIKIQQGVLLSDKFVLTELKQGNDLLMVWAEKELGEEFFLEHDQQVLHILEKIEHWLNANQFEPKKVRKFVKEADAYLIARAIASGYTVVTQEVRSNSKKKIKIPTVCDAFGVECINMETLLGFKKEEFSHVDYPNNKNWNFRKGVVETELGGHLRSIPFYLVTPRRDAQPKQFPPQLP